MICKYKNPAVIHLNISCKQGVPASRLHETHNSFHVVEKQKEYRTSMEDQEGRVFQGCSQADDNTDANS